MKNAYGLTSLMEAINASANEDKAIEEINMAVNESGSFLELGDTFLGSDPVEVDMDGEGDELDDDEEDQINAAIDMIPDDEDDDEDELLEESFDHILESAGFDI